MKDEPGSWVAGWTRIAASCTAGEVVAAGGLESSFVFANCNSKFSCSVETRSVCCWFDND